MDSPLTRKEHAYRALVLLITSGELKPGQAIDERDLIEKLGISRTPFREAISLLERDGLIISEPYRGQTVRALRRKEIDDLYSLRKALECFAIKLAVDNISNADIRIIDRILSDSLEALRRGDLQTYAERDDEFHRLIAELSGNSALIDTLERLSLQIRACRAIANLNPEFAEAAVVERDAILAALQARDAEGAANLLGTHISNAQAAVMTQLENIDFP